MDYANNAVINIISEYSSNVLENLYFNLGNHTRVITATICFEHLTNLTHLSCISIKLTNNELQDIFKNFKKLRYIALVGEYKISKMNLTDDGFIGEISENIQGYSISNLKHLKVIHIALLNSCLGIPTLLHIMKIKGLKYLYITCRKDGL